MAKYVSVKGWFECESHQVKNIKKIIDSCGTKNYPGNIFDNENTKLYNKGWCYPEEIINWTSYIFYGADIKEYYSGFIKDEIKEVLKKNTGIDGIFFFCYEEGETEYWKITDSEIYEDNIIKDANRT